MLAEIDADILPEIDQLQRRADRVGLRQVLIAGGTVQVQHQPAYRIGRSAAVFHDLGEVCIAGLGDVLGKRIEEIEKRLQRKVMGTDHLIQYVE